MLWMLPQMVWSVKSWHRRMIMTPLFALLKRFDPCREKPYLASISGWFIPREKIFLLIILLKIDRLYFNIVVQKWNRILMTFIFLTNITDVLVDLWKRKEEFLIRCKFWLLYEMLMRIWIGCLHCFWWLCPWRFYWRDSPLMWFIEPLFDRLPKWRRMHTRFPCKIRRHVWHSQKQKIKFSNWL